VANAFVTAALVADNDAVANAFVTAALAAVVVDNDAAATAFVAAVVTVAVVVDNDAVASAFVNARGSHTAPLAGNQTHVRSSSRSSAQLIVSGNDTTPAVLHCTYV
jgi:hypothetical protein